MRWKKLANGLPTIAVRDIAIQRRENDLVLGTFGRGFYVMDDYSSLRNIENSDTQVKSEIYPIREALRLILLINDFLAFGIKPRFLLGVLAVHT